MQRKSGQRARTKGRAYRITGWIGVTGAIVGVFTLGTGITFGVIGNPYDLLLIFIGSLALCVFTIVAGIGFTGDVSGAQSSHSGESPFL